MNISLLAALLLWMDFWTEALDMDEQEEEETAGEQILDWNYPSLK